MSRPLHARIDLAALRHNYQIACECFPHSHALAVVKADAYGHGAVLCAAALEPFAPGFAVASIEEALALRHGGIKKPIVLLEGFFSQDELPLLAMHNIWTAVHSQWQVDAILASSLETPISAWLKLDSGMHRLGFCVTELAANWGRLAASGKVVNMHLMTHFATADQAKTSYLDHQLANVVAAKEVLEQDGFQVPCCLANSPATLAQRAEGAWHRPGIMLYGCNPQEEPVTARLQPVMTLASELIAVRDIAPGEPVGYGGRFVATRPTRIGVVACGYGDGYDRHAREGTPVLVEGKRAPIAGRVSMDMLTVDITDIPEGAVGSRVTLWGIDADTGATLEVSEVARYCDTIDYTLLTGVMPRVPRHPVNLREAD